MKFKELTTKSESELRKMLEELRSEVHSLQMKVKLNESKATHKLKQMRKDIARLLTFLNAKKV